MDLREICKINLIDNQTKNGSFFREIFVKNNFPELYKDIIDFIKINNINTKSFKQSIFNYYNNLSFIPKCSCGKEVFFNKKL